MVGGILWIKTRLDPRSWICEEILELRPLMIDDIPITVATPITTPRMVRKDLSLLLRNESKASSRISFITQSHNGIEIRGFRRRIDTEEKPHRRGDGQS